MITVLSKPQLVKEIEFAPLDSEAARALLKDSTVAWSIRHLPRCSSTQDLAEEAVRRGQGAGLVISTDYQVLGRGRRGGRWRAPEGSALLVSILLQPPAGIVPLSPLVAGIAVVDAIATACGLRTDLKWPNDVMVDGRKLAGILVQRPAGGTVIAGIGINVGAHPGDVDPGLPATSIAAELGRPVAREPLLAAVLDAIAGSMRQAAAFGPAWVRTAWLARTAMIGRRFAFEESGRERRATAVDLLQDGSLLARTDEGVELRLVAGTVRQLRPDAPQS